MTNALPNVSYCPNCSAPLAPDCKECGKCGALFGTSAAWAPVAEAGRATGWSTTRLLLTYSLLGPPLGALLLAVSFGLMLILQLPGGALKLLAAIPLTFLLLLLGCYQVGAVAAIAAGLAHATFRSLIQSRASLIVVVATFAATAQYLFTTFQFAIDHSPPKSPSLMPNFTVAVAAVVALLIAAIATRPKNDA